MLRKAALFAALFIAVSLAGACSPRQGDQAVHHRDLSSLTAAAGFTFAYTGAAAVGLSPDRPCPGQWAYRPGTI